MNPRLRRLTSDYQRVLAVYQKHPLIRLTNIEGNPPERYLFDFHVQGLIKQDDGRILMRNHHRGEVFLPLDYPRRPPFCRMTTPVFHPNIDPKKICIGDHWSAGESLVHLVARIAQMICFQSYNVKSPLNAEAAVWAEKHTGDLPLQQADLTTGL